MAVIVAGDTDSRPAMVRVAIVRVGQLLQVQVLKYSNTRHQ